MDGAADINLADRPISAHSRFTKFKHVRNAMSIFVGQDAVDTKVDHPFEEKNLPFLENLPNSLMQSNFSCFVGENEKTRVNINFYFRYILT